MLNLEMSGRESLSGCESESSISSNSYIAHTMEFAVCETIPFSMSNSDSSVQEQYSCNICDTKKSQFNELRSHLFNHIGAIPYFCTVCNFSDISLTQLYLHLITHTEFVDDFKKVAKLKDMFNRMVYSCNLCSFSFKNNRDLATHYMKHITNSYKCKSCKFVFFTETELLIHAHIHSLSLVCRVCDKPFPSSQKVFLSHVLSHDYSRLYRNFPKISINHQDVPFYKSFLKICTQVSSVDFPMFCGILKTPHKSIKSKFPSVKDQNQSCSTIPNSKENLHSTSWNNGYPDGVESAGKKGKDSVEEEGSSGSGVFKFPDYPWKKTNKTDSLSLNQNEMQISIESVCSLPNGAHSTDKAPSSVKVSKKSDKAFINQPNLINEKMSIIDVAGENKGDDSNQPEASLAVPKCYIAISYSNASKNHPLIDVKDEILDCDVSETGNQGMDLCFENSSRATDVDKFSVFSSRRDCFKERKINYTTNNQNITPGIFGQRNLSVSLERLPEEIVHTAMAEGGILESFGPPELSEEIVHTAMAESSILESLRSPETEQGVYFKELLVVVPKLPGTVKDLASFRRYEKRQNKPNILTSTPRVTRSRRSSYQNQSPSKKSENEGTEKNFISSITKPDPESISFHNLNGTLPKIHSPPESIEILLDDIKTEAMDSSPFRCDESPANPLLESFQQIFFEEQPNGGLEANADLIMTNDEGCEHLCENGEDCCCFSELDCDSQSLDVEEDISDIKNRIMLMKSALNSVL